ncbi:MAG: small basic protein [Planctomycetota bacterium]
MSLHTSLKAAGGLSRHRNVLTKAERLAKLIANGKVDKDDPYVLGLPKTANRKLVVGKKTVKKPEAEDDKKAKKKK